MKNICSKIAELYHNLLAPFELSEPSDSAVPQSASTYLVQDIENETWRWYSTSSGYFGPEFLSEREAQLWRSRDLDSF